MKKGVVVLSLVITTISGSWVEASDLTPVQPAASEITPPPTPEAVAPEMLGDPIIVRGRQMGISSKALVDVRSAKDTGNVNPLLDKQSGLETQGEGLGKAWSSVAIRGQSFRETSILLNGVKMPESFNLGSIPTESLERIEVIEGPQALAYGSDSMGGALNIVTRQAQDHGWRAQVSIGSFNTVQYALALPTLKLGALRNSLSGSWFHTDGYLPPVTSGFNNLTFPFTDQEHWDLSDSLKWDLGGDTIDMNTTYFKHYGSAPDQDNVIAAGTDQFDLDGRQDAWGLQSLLQETHPLGDWNLSSSLSGDYSEVRRENPIGADPTSGVYDPYRNIYIDFGMKAQLSGALSESIPQAKVGIDAKQEGLSSGLYGDDRRRWTGSFLTAATLGATDALQLIVTNHLDDLGGPFLIDNPSATLCWAPMASWKWHLSGGTGAKNPTFDQLYLPTTAFASLPPALAEQYAESPFAGIYAGQKGNPSLGFERSLNAELGTDIDFGGVLIQLNGFANVVQGLIAPVLDPNDLFWSYANIEKAHFIGTEDSVKFLGLPYFTPYLSGTFINVRDQDWNVIQGRMRFKATAGFEIKPEPTWSLNFDARYVDRYPVLQQILTDLGKAQPPTDYWNLSIGAKYKVSEHLDGFMEMDNLLNSEIAVLQGIPLPGRTIRSGLDGHF